MSTNFQAETLFHAMTALNALGTPSVGEDAGLEVGTQILKRFFFLSESQRHWFWLLEETYRRNYPEDSFDGAMQRLLKRLPDDSRYQFACFLGRRFVEQGQMDRLHDYYPHFLVSERAQDLATEDSEITSAAKYDSLIHADGARELCFFALLDHYRTLQPNGLRILDIGCGTGLNSEFLIRYAAHLTGLDISLAALHESGRAKRYDRLIEGDAQDTIRSLETPMDLIILTGTAYFFRDLDWLFANASRLLAPGGQLVFNGFPAPDGADSYVTRAGNHRYCHSLDYLTRASEKHGLTVSQHLWKTAYGLPVWFLRFKRSPADAAGGSVQVW